MSGANGHTPRSILTALAVAAALLALPLSTLLHHPLSASPLPAPSQLAPLPAGDNAPAEDPDPAPVWAHTDARWSLWAPAAELPRARSEAFRHPGHPVRIDRPPRA